MKYNHLFQKGSIGTMSLKNRLVMPPMVRNYADEYGLVTPRYQAHIERIAKGGVGMMILEASYISQEGKGFANQLGIHSDKVIPGLKKLVTSAHKYGAKIGVQLYHAGRQTSSRISHTYPVAPSPIPDPTLNEYPHTLSVQEIKGLVKKFAKAAVRAKKTGCDFVEIHGAHGYLITQFLSAYSNKREDEYGGPLENRMRFLLEVISEVKKQVGQDFPVTLRLSGDELVPDGLKISDTKKIAKAAEQVGVHALHISAGNYASYAQGMMIQPMAIPDGPLLSLAAKVKSAVSIPVIAVGKIRDPKLANDAVKRNDADYIAIGRTLLADPDWPNKVKQDKFEAINPCIACNQGCIQRLFDQKDVWCTVNPETSRELAFAKKRGKKKRIVIVGGGPAGLEAARVAAGRGHKVILFEKEAKLGGQLFAAAASPHREGWEQLRKVLVRGMKRLKVDVRLKTECHAETVMKLKPDAVILAMGSSPVRPLIPGVGNTNVIVSRDLLMGKAKAKGSVIVVGGGCAGAQTAEYIAAQGNSVTIVEAGQHIALDAPVDDRTLLLARLEQKGVRILRNTKVMTIGPKSVTVQDLKGFKKMKADTVVLCLGAYPNDSLLKQLRPKIKQVTLVGDAIRARRVTDAMVEGAEAALSIG